MLTIRDLISRMVGFWRNVVHRERVERDLDDEMRALFEILVDEKMRSGLSGKAARRAALLELRGIEALKEQVREERTGALVDALLRDVGYGVRVLWRGRFFTAVAVLTLALGIGANSAVFSLVNGLLLRPLPYPETERLVWIATSLITPDNLGQWRAGMRSLERVGAFTLRSPVLTGSGPAERLGGMVVTEEVLPLLGAAPVSGRLWTADEQGTDGSRTVVVSERLWNRIGGGESFRAMSITLDGESLAVIGVLPASFADLHYESDVWFPASSQADERYNIIALRRPGVPISAVQAEATALAERVDMGGASPRTRFANTQAVSTVFKGDIRAPLLVLFAASGLVLLIACANVGNLLLSRAAGRKQELAVRHALGASRAILLRQMLTESAVLALAGALAGWLVAIGGLHAVLALVPEFYGMGRLASVRMDASVLTFTLVVGFATTLLVGLTPAVNTARDARRMAAGFTRASATRGVRRSREILMAGEVALALVLLIGTLLLIRTFAVLRPASPGFEAADRMVTRLRLPAEPPQDEVAQANFARRLLREVQAAAPAARVAIATDVPLSGFIMNFPIEAVDGAPIAEGQRDNLDLVAATPNYFDVLGIRMVRGRGVADSDLPGAARVAVINESAATMWWPDADPIGRRIRLDDRQETREFTVIGIAANTRSSGINTNSRPTAFVSFWQVPEDGFELVVHQPSGAILTGDAIRQIVASIDPGLPVGSIRMMDQIAARAVAEPRYTMILMTVFGALAVVLALVGCYGVLSYTVAQRTREIGVRVALGATRATIVRSVVLRGALLVGAGLATGTAAALALTRTLESSLYGVTPTDTASFAGAAAGLALVSLAAAYLPARRAADTPPVEALRAE